MVNLSNVYNNIKFRNIFGELIVLSAKFRCGNHNLPIESGCRRGIPHNLRICELCTKDIGDEFHYIFNCPHFENLQRKLKTEPQGQLPPSFKFITLMNVTGINHFYKLCKLIEKKILYLVK